MEMQRRRLQNHPNSKLGLAVHQRPRINIFGRQVAQRERRIVGPQPDPTTENESRLVDLRQTGHLLHPMIGEPNTPDPRPPTRRRKEIQETAVVRPMGIAALQRGEICPFAGRD